MTELDVSVVLPVYNERGHLREEINRIREALEASKYSFEIIVIDDGSNDGSEVDLPTIPDIRLIRHRTNQGSGAARRTGTRAANGRVVVWTDVDMTYPNNEIPWLVDQLEGYDHVVGARRTEEGTVKFLRKPAKLFIRKLASYLTETDIKDLNSGLRAFRRDVAMQYVHHLPKGFSCVTTLTLSFLANGYSVGYVPIDYFPRAGKSKFHWWSDTKRYILQVIRMTLSYNPLKVFLPFGVCQPTRC
jgi:glycosyltransferase involved in cell wall biosynthesis